MRALIVLTLVSLVPRSPVVHDSAELLELNHTYSASGEPALEQLIFWEWHEATGAYRVIDWRLKPAGPAALNRAPHHEQQRFFWLDGDLLRALTFDYFRETWTQHDPELEDRASFPKERRRKLSPPP